MTLLFTAFGCVASIVDTRLAWDVEFVREVDNPSWSRPLGPLMTAMACKRERLLAIVCARSNEDSGDVALHRPS